MTGSQLSCIMSFKKKVDLWLRFVKLLIKNTIISCMDCEVKGKVLEMTEL